MLLTIADVQEAITNARPKRLLERSSMRAASVSILERHIKPWKSRPWSCYHFWSCRSCPEASITVFEIEPRLLLRAHAST